MKKASIIYEETRILTAKYYHPKSDDYLDYISKIRIKNSGKNALERDRAILRRFLKATIYR